MIDIMIADDDIHAQDDLVRLVGEYSDLRIMSRVASGTAVIEQIKNIKIDVAFLDIEMPGISGLEAAFLLNKLPKPPYIVFVSAYQKYAIEAFEANAVDYLLKPVNRDRLKQTMDRVRARLFVNERNENFPSLEKDLMKRGLLKRIAAHEKNHKDQIILDPQNVFYFSVHHTDVFAHLSDRQLIVDRTLKELLEELDPREFARTHKSHIVNLQKIEKVSPLFYGDYEILLKNSEHSKIPLSRSYAKNVKIRLGI